MGNIQPTNNTTPLSTAYDAAAIPDEMKARPNWVAWRPEQVEDRITKVLYRAAALSRKASSTDPSTWCEFETALAAVENSQTPWGIGYVFTKEGRLVGVDLDHCHNPETGEIEPWAQEIIENLDSYTEISPSGTGVHVYVYGEKPPGRSKRGGVEMYDTARYFTVTGRHLEGTPLTIEERPFELHTVHAEHLADADTPPEPSTPPPQPSNESDQTVLDRASRAKNGMVFDQLYGGSTDLHQSHSEADAALISMLWFYSGGDRQLVDAMFRQSGLMRAKWDAKHGAKTYGEMTLDLGCKGETYTGGRTKAPTSNGHHAGGGAIEVAAAIDQTELVINQTDIGNCRRLAALFGQDFRWVSDFKKFYVWDQRRWAADTTQMQAFAKDSALAIYGEAAEMYQAASQLEGTDKEVGEKLHACCQSAKVGRIGTRENYCYGEPALNSLTVLL